ncbi:E3 ubiquitin-protein ligase TRIM7-like [Carettochelys insculpta]|uniref:E3 ubiquitin-protein ligase TRIM7-like n=1 Tax=Carettochelys insculpta TaxID=44489 RepID=UPI003EB74861
MQREKLLGLKQTAERSREYLKKTEAEREKIVAEFRQLRQFLKEQEHLLLAQLEKEIVKLWNDKVAKLSTEISRLSDLISEVEGKMQQPPTEFLQVP